MTRLGFVINKKFNNVVVSSGSSSVIVSSPGNLPYASSIDSTGVPIFDGSDAGNHEACFVGIADAASAASLYVSAGPAIGDRIVGLSYSDVPGNSIKINFYSVPTGSDLDSIIPYTWEIGQPMIVDMYYGFRQRLDQVTDTAIRYLYASGALTSVAAPATGINASQHASLRQLIHLADGDGPFEQFVSGAYKEIYPSNSAFPTSITWYEGITKTKKIVEKLITRDSSQNPVIISWRVYDTDGSTILNTVSDSITYSGPFELNRIRTIS